MVLGYESLSAPTFGPVSPRAPGLIAPRGGATESLGVGDWGSSYKAYYVKSTVSTFNLFMVGSRCTIESGHRACPSCAAVISPHVRPLGLRTILFSKPGLGLFS